MVHSNGTRSESHLFRIERTGSRKYSGLSRELRRLSAVGDKAARRAMPTSGACAPGAAEAATLSLSDAVRRGVPPVPVAGGGQSASQFAGVLPRTTSGASSRSRMLGLCSGPIGKRRSEEVGTRRRGIGKPGAEKGEESEGRTGDITHLVAQPVFRFLFAMSRCFSPFLCL